MSPRNPQIRNNRSLQIALRRLIDLACIFLGLTIAGQYGQRLDQQQFFVTALTSCLVYLFASGLTANYRTWRGATFMGEIAIAWLTWSLTLVGVIVIGAVVQYGSGLTRFSFGLWTIMTCLLLGMSRSTLRTIRSVLWSKGFHARGFAIVGITEIGIQLARNIADSPQLGLRLIGFYDDRPPDRTSTLPDEFGVRMGNIEELVDLTRKGEIHTVYLTFPMRAEDRIRSVLEVLSDTTASVYIVPDFFVFELLHSRWNNIQGIPVVSIFENPLYGVDGMLKRLVDVTLGTAILLMAALPMAIVALLVRLTSPGPILFRQRRYGLDGKEIYVLKFRSMRVCENGAHVMQAQQGDPRVTPIGGILRRTSLDELPQLFNVLAGSMSLVGPRPHATAHNEEYRQQIHGYMLRHKVKPGITGLAQVEGWRGETDTLEKMEKRIECDHQYIHDWNLWLDVKILIRTVAVVLSGKNAH